MDSTEVIIAIVNGKLDDDLESLAVAIQQRIKTKAQIVALSLRLGDQVKFTNVRPKYLIGNIGTIVKISPETIVVDLLEPAGRYHKNITCKADMIEKV